MLRLTLLLCFGMIAALFTLGEDRGQLRPGLAEADAEGRLDEVWAEARAKAAPLPVVELAPAPVVAEVSPIPEPAPVIPEAAPAVATAAVELAGNGTVVEVEAGREIVREVEEPVFTLSALGNELVPGEDGTPVEASVAGAASSPSGGTIWYVTADSVNVRAAPSTDADVLERLGSGEAALLVAAVDAEWARIVIQGDGVEGYVAIRYLSPDAP